MFSVLPIVRECLRPTPKLPVDEWLRQHVILDRATPIPGRFDIANSPWIREPLAKLSDHTVREIICACSVQSAKTAMMEGAILYLIAQDAADAIVYCQTDQASDEFLDDRFKYRILSTPPVASLLQNGSKGIQKLGVNFSHMKLFCFGAHSIHNLQSKPAKYVFGDESAYWPHGHIEESRKRTTAYDRSGSKRIYISTPLDNTGDFHDGFKNGTRCEWHVKCPVCGEGFQMRWNGLRYDTTGAKLEDGTYDFGKVIPTIHYLCPNEQCGAQLKDEPRTRKEIAKSGYYVSTNPAANPEVASYHWNALTVPWVEWSRLVTEWLTQEMAWQLGDHTPRAEFIRKRLGEFWDVSAYGADEVIISATDVSMSEKWQDEFRRYLTVDVQKDWFRVIVRAWANDARSRLLHAGECKSWQQIAALQEQFEITPRRVFVDCGWERFRNEVYRQCASHGWIALMGDGTDAFRWRIRNHKTGKIDIIKRPYSQPEQIDSGVGLARQKVRGARQADLCTRILWSNAYIKPILHRLKTGQGAAWEVPRDAPKWYFKELAGEILVTEPDKRTGQRKTYSKKIGANHAFDCYDAETEVLTRDRGFVSFDSLAIEEPLATVNLESDIIEYQEPVMLIKKHFVGEMVSVEAKNMSVCVTPSHRMVVYRKKWVGGRHVRKMDVIAAEELTMWDALKVNTGWDGPNGSMAIPRKRKRPAVDLCKKKLARLIGWFVSEGCMFTTKQGCRTAVLSQKPGEKHDVMASDLAALPWTWDVTSGRQFRCTESQLCDLLVECGRGAANKRVPQWVKNASPEIIGEFLDTARMGDGWTMGKLEVFSTISKRLAEDYAELVLKMGRRCSFRTVQPKPYCINGRSGTNTQVQYWVYSLSTKMAHLRRGDGTRLIKRVPYDGMVYCATVPNGTLIVRRRGKIIVCGNCECEQVVAACIEKLFGEGVVDPEKETVVAARG